MQDGWNGRNKYKDSWSYYVRKQELESLKEVRKQNMLDKGTILSGRKIIP